MGALLLSLFIINLGIALGAGLYESRIVVPQWLVRSSDGRTHWNAAAAVAAGPVRSWWLTAVIAAALDRASTFGYFIPTMLRLTRPDGPTGADAARLATRWAQLDYVRHGLTLLALVAALCALTLLTEPNQT
jgi:hypothetical protein